MQVVSDNAVFARDFLAGAYVASKDRAGEVAGATVHKSLQVRSCVEKTRLSTGSCSGFRSIIPSNMTQHGRNPVCGWVGVFRACVCVRLDLPASAPAPTASYFSSKAVSHEHYS